MDAEDLELFERSVRHAVDSSPTGAVDAALDETGWLEAMEVAPREVVSTVATAVGAAPAASAAAHRIVAIGLTGLAEQPPAILPPLGASTPPGRAVDGTVVIEGIANRAAIAGDLVTVAVTDGDIVRPLLVSPGELDLTPVQGIDPEAGLVLVSGTSGQHAGPTTDPGDWTEAVRLGRLALTHELLGASRTILELAREHALERIQFDQPIARFQAVRHKLAEILIAIETAEASAEAAWLDGTELTAAMAKASAGRAGRVAAKHGQQVLAGIGFTMEHDLHHSVRRVLLVDELLGSSRALTKQLGADLLASRTLPPLLPL